MCGGAAEGETCMQGVQRSSAHLESKIETLFHLLSRARAAKEHSQVVHGRAAVRPHLMVKDDTLVCLWAGGGGFTPDHVVSPKVL